MTIFISIVGLGLLVFVHELGHFTASVALRMHPRKFYIGFPPALVKRTRNGIEYGIGTIPLGGFVKIPGMHRPASSDVDPVFGRAIEEAPGLAGEADRLRRSLDSGDHDAARASLASFATLAGQYQLSEPALAGVDKGVTDIGDALGPDAYWRARTWKRVLVIFAGPAANIIFAFVLFTGLFMTSGGKATTTVDSVRVKTAAAALGLQSGDKIVAINGKAMESGSTISDTIGGSQGKPLSVVVLRNGNEVTLGPKAATKIDGTYRLGFILRGAGLPPPAAVKEAGRVTGVVSKGIVTSLGNLVTGGGAEGHLEPRRHRPGLVRRRQGGHGQLPLGPRADLAVDRAAQPAAVPAARRRPHRLRDRRGHPGPHGSARGLRAGLDRRDRARAAAVRDRAHERHRPALLASHGAGVRLKPHPSASGNSSASSSSR